jgi:hypothetical protein
MLHLWKGYWEQMGDLSQSFAGRLFGRVSRHKNLVCVPKKAYTIFPAHKVCFFFHQWRLGRIGPQEILLQTNDVDTCRSHWKAAELQHGEFRGPWSILKSADCLGDIRTVFSLGSKWMRRELVGIILWIGWQGEWFVTRTYGWSQWRHLKVENGTARTCTKTCSFRSCSIEYVVE